jgi:hypothetical protein
MRRELEPWNHKLPHLPPSFPTAALNSSLDGPVFGCVLLGFPFTLSLLEHCQMNIGKLRHPILDSVF